MSCEISVVLFAPKAMAGFMHGTWPVIRQCVHRYNFFDGSLIEALFAFPSSWDWTSASTLSMSSSPRNFFKRICGPVGGPRVKSSRGKGRKSHTLFGSFARDSMTYAATWLADLSQSNAFSSSSGKGWQIDGVAFRLQRLVFDLQRLFAGTEALRAMF